MVRPADLAGAFCGDKDAPEAAVWEHTEEPRRRVEFAYYFK